jgi:hypothetical protein
VRPATGDEKRLGSWWLCPWPILGGRDNITAIVATIEFPAADSRRHSRCRVAAWCGSNRSDVRTARGLIQVITLGIGSRTPLS